LDIEEKREERAPKRIRKPSVRALEAAAAAATKVNVDFHCLGPFSVVMLVLVFGTLMTLSNALSLCT